MFSYYTRTLSAQKLKRVYEVVTPRVQQYLNAEVNHVLEKLRSSDWAIELGCGYGRIFPSLSKKAKSIIGIDTSLSSLMLGKEMFGSISNCFFAQMNAEQLSFLNHTFDVVVCIQNGISAFHVDMKNLIEESIRVTKRGGIVLFSSYSEKFWDYRLEWFQMQSNARLLGEIDYKKTKNGNIVCKDGFTATTVSSDQFKALTSSINNISVKIEEVDSSSLFCEIVVTG
ncbi:MAG: class I SAM-dependent methyltransferase [Ignavibacteria bacterium]|nr:class I SAM-dependent methyltransferase [Ignavibacteria bacterium]